MSFTDFIPYTLRLVLVAAALFGGQSYVHTALRLRKAPRPLRAKGEKLVTNLLVGVSVGVLADIGWIMASGGPQSSAVIPWGLIIVGFTPLGWLVTLTLIWPVVMVPMFKTKIWRGPLLEMEIELAELKHAPERIFDPETGAGVLARRADKMSENAPSPWDQEYREFKREVMELQNDPSPEVCVDQAVKAMAAGKSDEGLIWLDRWDSTALETLLVRLEEQGWDGCVEAAPRLSAELGEEVLQMVADLPKSKDLRDAARKGMRGSQTLRRRRAVREFNDGRLEQAREILQFDWEAVNWLRAAKTIGGTQSPVDLTINR